MCNCVTTGVLLHTHRSSQDTRIVTSDRVLKMGVHLTQHMHGHLRHNRLDSYIHAQEVCIIVKPFGSEFGSTESTILSTDEDCLQMSPLQTRQQAT